MHTLDEYVTFEFSATQFQDFSDIQHVTGRIKIFTESERFYTIGTGSFFIINLWGKESIWTNLDAESWIDYFSPLFANENEFIPEIEETLSQTPSYVVIVNHIAIKKKYRGHNLVQSFIDKFDQTFNGNIYMLDPIDDGFQHCKKEGTKHIINYYESIGFHKIIANDTLYMVADNGYQNFCNRWESTSINLAA